MTDKTETATLAAPIPAIYGKVVTALDTQEGPLIVCERGALVLETVRGSSDAGEPTKESHLLPIETKGGEPVLQGWPPFPHHDSEVGIWLGDVTQLLQGALEKAGLPPSLKVHLTVHRDVARSFER